MGDEEDEEEVVDPKLAADEHCAKTDKCARLMVEYEKCSERIEAKGSGHCSGQYMDYIACVDSCVSRCAAVDHPTAAHHLRRALRALLLCLSCARAARPCSLCSLDPLNLCPTRGLLLCLPAMRARAAYEDVASL